MKEEERKEEGEIEIERERGREREKEKESAFLIELSPTDVFQLLHSMKTFL